MLILLAMTFFQQLTMKMVPLQDFPLISQYFLVTTVEIGIALLITTLTLNFYHQSHSRMPGIMKRIIIYHLGRITRIRAPMPEDSKKKKRRKGLTKRSLRLSERTLQLSANSRDTNTADSQFDFETESATRPHILETSLNDSSVGLVSFKSTNESGSSSSSAGVRGDTVDTRWSDVEQDGIKADSRDWNKDWVLASRIIDRFCMYAAIVVGILTVLIVFLRAPRFWSSRTSVD